MRRVLVVLVVLVRLGAMVVPGALRGRCCSVPAGMVVRQDPVVSAVWAAVGLTVLTGLMVRPGRLLKAALAQAVMVAMVAMVAMVVLGVVVA